MLNRRVTFWAAITLIAVLALSGCAPRAGQGSVAGDADQLVIDLPALVLDFGMDGTPMIKNAALSGLVDTLGGQLDVTVPPDMVFLMEVSNIQHIQVSNTPDGLLLLVNGRSIPSISYKGDSLSALPGALSTFGMVLPMADLLFALVDQLGIGVIARFPVAPGMEEIPLYIEGDSSAAMAAKAAQEEFLAAVGTPPRINLPIFYEANGDVLIGDLSIAEMNMMTDYALAPLAMTLGQLGMARMLGISQLGISTNVDGITISIDGKALPTLDWSDGKASNLVELVTTIPLLDMAMPGIGSMLPMINQILPLVQATEFDLTLHF